MKKIFSVFGTVDYISLPRYKHNKRHKGFAFIEFADPETAQKVVAYFESVGCKLPMQMPPNQLISIITFERDGVDKQPEVVENIDNIKINENVSTDNVTETQKKRKHSLENEAVNIKKAKQDEVIDIENKTVEKSDEHEEKGEDEEEINEEVMTDGTKRKRKRKKTKRNECDFTQMGLQVLSK